MQLNALPSLRRVLRSRRGSRRHASSRVSRLCARKVGCTRKSDSSRQGFEHCAPAPERLGSCLAKRSRYGLLQPELSPLARGATRPAKLCRQGGLDTLLRRQLSPCRASQRPEFATQRAVQAGKADALCGASGAKTEWRLNGRRGRAQRLARRRTPPVAPSPSQAGNLHSWRKMHSAYAGGTFRGTRFSIIWIWIWTRA